tara:strand:- start:304 stop:522 length:219 start_codon:yes stop_codon:yes gene_type:complete
MSNYADFYGKDESKILYESYRIFHLKKSPPISKLKFFASAKQASAEGMSQRYSDIHKKVIKIRKMIRKELKK